MLNIIKYPNQNLRQVASAVKMPTKYCERLINEMLDTAKNTPDTIGLAATQVGVPKRIIVVLIRNQWVYMINPRVYEKFLAVPSVEECLSCPGLRKIVSRFSHIRVSYVDLRMQKHTMELQGLEAFCVQHEIDHLEGRTLYDIPGQNVN